MTRRIEEIEDFYRTLYENLTKRIISEERFRTMSNRYDAEEKELRQRIETLREAERAERSERENIDLFVKMAGALDELEVLDYAAIHKFIDRVYVYEKCLSDGTRHIKLKISYKYIGALDMVSIRQ